MAGARPCGTTELELTAFEASERESRAVAALHRLNAQFVAAYSGGCSPCVGLVHSDFTCTTSDGERIGADEFLRRLEARPRRDAPTCDEVDVRLLDDVALVHGVLHEHAPGVVVLTRYTAVWRSGRGGWQLVALHFTRLS
jgi:hypothetical protein